MARPRLRSSSSSSWNCRVLPTTSRYSSVRSRWMASMTAASCLESVKLMRSISPWPPPPRSRVTSRATARVVFGVAGSRQTDCCR